MRERRELEGGAQHRPPRNALSAHWPEFRGRVQERWSRLNDEWLDEVDGRRDRLAARLRDAYGVSEEEANRQVDDFVETHWSAMSARSMNEPQPRDTGATHSPGPTGIRSRSDDSGIGTSGVNPGGRKI